MIRNSIELENQYCKKIKNSDLFKVEREKRLTQTLSHYLYLDTDVEVFNTIIVFFSVQHFFNVDFFIVGCICSKDKNIGHCYRVTLK